MLTGILTKPANIDKGQDNIMTLDRDALLADVIANKDSYFHQLSRWSQVLITYKSSQGEQLNHLEFDPTTGAFPVANFNPSNRARDIWEVQTIMVRDLDDGEIIYYRDEVDTGHFDITFQDQTAPTLTYVNISSDNTNPAIANVGDVITVSFTSNEDLGSISVLILGEAATLSGSGMNWTASYTVAVGDQAGLVPFSIDFDDLSGNSGTTVTSTTDTSKVDVVITEWVESTIPDSYYRDSIYAYGKHIVIGNLPDITANSINGSNWTIATTNPSQLELPNGLINGNNEIISMAYNAVSPESNSIMKSSDGINWTFQNNPHTPSGGLTTYTNWRVVAYTGTSYVAIGQNSESNANDSSNAPIIMRSTDYTNWTVLTVPNIQGERVTYGNGTLIATGGSNDNLGVSGYLRSTNDGLNWTLIDPTPKVDIFAYGNSKFIGVDNSTYIVTSVDDGLTFSQSHFYRIGNDQTFMVDMKFTGNRFVACGWVKYGVDIYGDDIVSGVIWESTDGISWTHEIVGDTKLQTISHNGNNVVVCGFGNKSYYRNY